MQFYRNTDPNITNGTPYKRVRCLSITWGDQALTSIIETGQVKAFLEKHFQAKTIECVLNWVNGDAGKSLSHAVDHFMRYEDIPESLLILLYSGGSSINETTGNFELDTQGFPGIDWIDTVGDKLLTTTSDLLLLFDLPTLTPGELPIKIFWSDVKLRFDLVRLGAQQFQLHAVTFSGCGFSPLIDRLKSFESQTPRNVFITDLYDFASESIAVDAFAFTPDAISLDNKLAVFKDINPRHQYVLLEDQHIFQDAKVIHEGGYCRVLRVGLDENCSFPEIVGQFVAIKQFRARGPREFRHMRQSYLDEREILIKIAEFHHERILGLLTSFQVRSPRKLSFNLIFPFASGGDLRSFLRLEVEPDWETSEFPKSFVDGKFRDWRLSIYDEVLGIAEGLEFLHDEKHGFIVLHRDIKPSNILIDAGKLKLADFGVSKFKGSEETSKTDWGLGTLMYAPPEKETADPLGRARDMWALGCVFLEIAMMMRFAFLPNIVYTNGDTNIIDFFESGRKKSSSSSGKNETAIYHKTMHYVKRIITSFGTVQDPLKRAVTTEGLLPVISGLLDEDPEKRRTAKEVVEYLSYWSQLFEELSREEGVASRNLDLQENLQ